MSVLRVGGTHFGKLDNLGFFFNRLRGSRLKLLELTFVKILDLKVAVFLAVHLKVALRISLKALEVFQIHGVKHLPGPTS